MWIDSITSAVLTALANGFALSLVLTLGLAGLLWAVASRRPIRPSLLHTVWMVLLLVVTGLTVMIGLNTLPEVESPMTMTGTVEVSPVESTVTMTTAPAPMVAVEPLDIAPIPSERLQITLPERVQAWAPMIVLIWLIGAGALLLRVGFGLVMVTWLKRNSRSLPLDLAVRLEDDLRAADVRRGLRIGQTNRFKTPAALGLIRPMILLPESLVAQLSSSELKQVVLHEAAHLERRDDWAKLVQKILQAVLFMFPAVYWIGRELERVRERACDAWVIDRTQQPRPYAACLVRLVELNLRAPQPLLSTGIASPKAELFARVQAVLRHDDENAGRRSRWIYGGLVAMMIGCVAFSGAFPMLTMPESEAMVEVELLPVLVEVKVPEAVEAAEAVVLVEALEPVERVEAVELVEVSETPVELAEIQVSPVQVRDPNTVIKVLRAARGVSSSGDRAALMLQAVSRLEGNAAALSVYLETARTIPSSGDRARVLLALLEHETLRPSSALEMLDVIRSIPSSGDRKRVLTRFADAMPDDPEVRSAYLRLRAGLR